MTREEHNTYPRGRWSTPEAAPLPVLRLPVADPERRRVAEPVAINLRPASESATKGDEP